MKALASVLVSLTVVISGCRARSVNVSRATGDEVVGTSVAGDELTNKANEIARSIQSRRGKPVGFAIATIIAGTNQFNQSSDYNAGVLLAELAPNLNEDPTSFYGRFNVAVDRSVDGELLRRAYKSVSDSLQANRVDPSEVVEALANIFEWAKSKHGTLALVRLVQLHSSTLAEVSSEAPTPPPYVNTEVGRATLAQAKSVAQEIVSMKGTPIGFTIATIIMGTNQFNQSSDYNSTALLAELESRVYDAPAEFYQDLQAAVTKIDGAATRAAFLESAKVIEANGIAPADVLNALKTVVSMSQKGRGSYPLALVAMTQLSTIQYVALQGANTVR